jgi:uncharacterized protein DUF3667
MACLRRLRARSWRCLAKPLIAVPSHTGCGNCGATLAGPYCSSCGQHAHDSARSIAALFHDAWHIATHVDSRFWQTMYILLCRPGKLTKEYFAEHRARYLPPVRVYLVLSVLFFAFGLAAPSKVRVATLPDGTTAKTALRQLASEDVPGSTTQPKSSNQDSDTIVLVPGAKTKGFFGLSSCEKIEIPVGWLQQALQRSCQRNIENHGDAIKHAFIANIPKMMFVFVPLMALVMLLLYWRPRRYYVEHLVFFLHNHAAVFLLLLIQASLSWIAAWLAWRTFNGWVIAFISLYTVWYVYKAMRSHYGQGRFLSLTKLCVVGFTYMIGFSVTLLATLLLSAIIA